MRRRLSFIHKKGPIPYEHQYLTFEPLSDSTFSFTTNNIQYKIDDGSWTTLTAGSNTPVVAVGSKILWRASLTSVVNVGIGKFSSSASFNAYGNPLSLILGDNFKDVTVLPESTYLFYNLFNGSKIVNAENIKLVCTVLRDYCYRGMFGNCSQLTDAPELPAENMVESCYRGMFENCVSLIHAPHMDHCITTGPYCCKLMFKGCSSLTHIATELPAMTLANDCYANMYNNCTQLEEAPVLPALTLASKCYEFMFSGCSKLKYIKAMFTTTPGSSYTNSWVKNVPSGGTFVKNRNATWTTTGNNGVPTGWTVVREDT